MKKVKVKPNLKPLWAYKRRNVAPPDTQMSIFDYTPIKTLDSDIIIRVNDHNSRGI